MKPQQIIILQGLPASGKTTWSREFIKNSPGWKRINKDDLRRMLDVGVWSKNNERHILRIRDNLIVYFLNSGFNIIIDDTNFSVKHIRRIYEIANDYKNVTVEFKVFNVDPKECIERNKLRPEQERVPEQVIWDMYNRYLRPNEYINEGPANQDKSLPRAIICDLDGTLAIIGERSPYDCLQCQQDTVNESVKNLVLYYVAGHIVSSEPAPQLFFFSGRSEKCRENTIKWLEKQGFLPDNFILVMRENLDTRKDAVVKLEMYNKHIKNKYYVNFVLDDRDQVVEMWRKTLGLTCLQVNYGNF